MSFNNSQFATRTAVDVNALSGNGRNKQNSSSGTPTFATRHGSKHLILIVQSMQEYLTEGFLRFRGRDKNDDNKGRPRKLG